MNPNKIISITKDLVSINSVSYSKDNKDKFNEDKVAEHILSFYKKHNISHTAVKTPDGRTCVVACQKGSSNKALVLIGHHDTVGVEDYSSKDPFSTDGKDPKYLYGRGSGDMKAGIAVGMELMRELSKSETKLSIYFISAPDEENESSGILEGIRMLSKEKSRKKLEFIGSINLDCGLNREDDPSVSVVVGGAIGKMLPTFLVVGKAAHASDPFAGINSNSIAGHIFTEFDSNSEYSEKSTISGETAPPPVCLKMQDLKSEYNVQTPLKSYLYFNYHMFSESPSDVLKKCKNAAKIALKNAFNENDEKYTDYCKKASAKPESRGWTKKIQVYSFDEILKKVDKKISKKILDEYKKKDLDDREKNVRIVEEICSQSGVNTPYVVCFFSPPFYPSSYSESRFTKTLLAQLSDYSKKENVLFSVSKVAEGVSDMNYLQIDSKTSDTLDEYVQNDPISKLQSKLDITALRNVSMPIASIGPRGINAHQDDEKVEIDFTFYKLPFLLLQIVNSLDKTYIR